MDKIFLNKWKTLYLLIIKTYHDYDNYNTPNTIKVDEATFTTPSSTDKQATSTLRPRQKVKRDKRAALFKHLNVTLDLD